jgi:hypothetical protein
MGIIYERAYVTVAATNGKDGDVGLFNVVIRITSYVKVPCDAEVPELGYMYFSRLAA